MKTSTMKTHKSDLAWKIIVTTAIVLFSASFLFVLVWMVMNSVRPQKAYFKRPYEFWDLKGATFENYIAIFRKGRKKRKISLWQEYYAQCVFTGKFRTWR